jgi:glycosyltransferase involved in cell wall biosynthesis
VLIPARNEETNLALLLPALKVADPSVEILVFDDESSDATAAVARSFGAKVISPEEPLPAGWTGKNRACEALARAAHTSEAEWWLFLDADVRPGPEFLNQVRAACGSAAPKVGVVTGFGQVIPGEGLEPLFLAWVGWILLATNPFWLVSRTGFGHNFFTNGQIHAWRSEVYVRLKPNEVLKGAILEDVRIGRLLAKQGVGVEVVLFTRQLRVAMYRTWREALDGMSKNAFEIAGGALGTWLLAALLTYVGVGFLIGGLSPWALALLVASGLFSALALRVNVLMAPLMPLICVIGSFTLIRSWWWRRKGKVSWKGRTY